MKIPSVAAELFHVDGLTRWS